MKRFILLAAISVAACSGSNTEPFRPARTYSNETMLATDPLWTANTSAYTQIRVRLVERPDDHVIFGQWGGDRVNCTTPTTSQPCRDTGIVITGTGLRNGNAMRFALTSLNGARSLWFDGTIAPDSSMSGQIYIFQDASAGAKVAVTLQRSR